MSLPQHPLSAAFPAMSAQDLSDLADDIAAHGLRQPVVTYQGAVLDGWHRYSACLHAEVRPALVEYDGDNPVAFVLSLNMHRRNLTASQRAAAVVACSEWKPTGRPVLSQKGEPGAPFTVEEMAKTADVSTRTIQQAKKGHAAGRGGEMRDGKISAKEAARDAPSPDEKRQDHSYTPPVATEDDDAERMADIVADYEAALRIIEADDKVSEAWQCVKEMRQRLDDLEKLYKAQRVQLADMTREAKRWQRKAESK